MTLQIGGIKESPITAIYRMYCYEDGIETIVTISKGQKPILSVVLEGAKWRSNSTRGLKDRGDKCLALWLEFVAKHPEQVLAAKRVAMKELINELSQNLSRYKQRVDEYKREVAKIKKGLKSGDSKYSDIDLEVVNGDLLYSQASLNGSRQAINILRAELKILKNPDHIKKRTEGADKIKNKFPWLKKQKV